MAQPFGWVIPPGYAFDNLGTCSSCRAPIAWCYTPKGNRIPMNADGITHFATCPNAGEHRRPKAPEPPPPVNPSPPPTAPPPTSSARRREVLRRLRKGGWVDGTALATEECGGSEGLRRLRELREYGYKIESRRHPSAVRNLYQYRLVAEPDTAPPTMQEGMDL